MSSENNSSDSTYIFIKFGAVILVAGLIWLFIRNNTQSQLNSFNRCQDRAFSNAENTTRAVANSGLYNSQEVSKASFDTTRSELDACWQTVPPPSNFMMFITGVKG